MSEERNFDDHIRQEFNNFSPDVPPYVWENIVAARKKRKPVGFWWSFYDSKNLFWLAGLILVGSVGGVIISHSFNSSETHKTSAKKNTAPLSDNIESKKGLTTITKGENKNPVATSINNINTRDNSSSQINNGKINTTTIVQPSSLTSEKNTIVSSDVKRNHLSHSASIVKTKAILRSNSNVDNTIAQSAIESDEKNDVAHRNSIFENRSASTNNSIANASIKNNSQKPTRLLFSSVEKPLFDLTTGKSLLQQKNVPAVHLPECPTVEKDAAGNKRYFEIYVAPDYALRTLTDTANSVYLQKRKQSAVFSSAFSAGARYTRVFNNGMSVKFGLNFSQINEKFSYVQSSVIQTTYTIDPATGDTTGSYTVRGTRYKTTYNHYRSIDIPVTIGYEFGNGRLHTNINAGLIANIYSWQKGDVLDTNYIPVSITTGKDGSSLYQFKTNVGLGATAGVSLYYKLTEQIHFLAEPYIRYNFQPMSSGNLTLRQKYTTIGLRLGLRFDLPYPGSIIKR
jgi:opacity protein-like surface antigen